MSQSPSRVPTADSLARNWHPSTVSEIGFLVQRAAKIRLGDECERIGTSDVDTAQSRIKETIFVDSALGAQDGSRHSPLLPPNPGVSPSPGPVFVVVQEWEGYVTEIREHEFVAHLLDITADARRAEEEATISFDEISSMDRETMRLGSIFRWVIGYEHTVSGVKRRVSQIVFRQLPVLTQADWDEAWEWALETRQLLGLE